MASLKIKRTDIDVGSELPWSVFDAAGNLLLRAGYVIGSERQLEGLLARGMYREQTANEATDDVAPQDSQAPRHPFEYFVDFGARLERIFAAIEARAGGIEPQILELCDLIDEQCQYDPDAALGILHLCHEPRYVIAHPLHAAMLSDLVARRMEFGTDKRRMIVAAALTANVSMLQLQEELQAQAGPLSAEQRAQVQRHPERSVRLLKDSGIHHDLWLKIVLQHHERLDGSGYPLGLSGTKIAPEAMLLAIADRYAAMVSGRAYRGAIPARDVLKEFFLSKGRQYDETLSLLAVKELGIFPPGGFVALANGDKAVVVKRPPLGSLYPIVSSYADAQGQVYSRPVRRNTAHAEFMIKDAIEPEAVALNLAMLWGYR